MHIRISLKEYVLRPNMFCVIITGMIFEVLSINYDFRGFMIATRTDFMPTTEKTTQVMSFYKCLQNRHCFTFAEKEAGEFVRIYRSAKATLQESDHPFTIPMLQSYVQILYYRRKNRKRSIRARGKRRFFSVSSAKWRSITGGNEV